ncbi:GerMN domain-containing protein [Amycolatopsis regifaucium]|uniref:GerMN domain-containing protein n=1 Tax=Amycolatopsis regifaucium TaxID=546365 RepID=A0A154MWB6_9PSEU|nr:GerMN domain-containing protein [Amycolatopsis regifaucium]KZB88591.1 hypothetical protein AVL48_00480 [Amycolatopsis regifaucium]OKA07238.1 hypothetical protein ATP06_0215310 [Amycolatopsis regifaucium]SFI52624.1 Sporulation and spore germination [Amycolatopsis regifaucium]
MKRTWLTLPIALSFLAWALTGCGVRPSGVILGGPAPEGQATLIPGAPVPSRPATELVLYFVFGGEPVRVVRPHAEDDGPGHAIELLAAGPDDNERGRGYATEVPPGTAVLGQAVEPGGITVNLSVGVAGLSARAVDQIVCTARDSLGGNARITLRGGGTARGPLSCPLPG